MAWNEPGGGKDQDPWGGRGGDQGPPDLDEAFRQFQSRLSKIFGGGGGSGSGGQGGGGRTISASFIGFALAALAIVYGFWGVYQVDQQERGVVFRFGKAQSDLIFPGLHWNPPLIDVVEKVNVTRVNSTSHTGLMLTEDENIVDVNLTVQYIVDRPVDFIVNVKNPGVSLEQATESALRHVVGSSSMDSVITEGREALGIEVQERLQTYLNLYGTGIVVRKVNIDQSGPPRQVQEAFDDVQKAKEDEVRSVNDANAYAESVVPDARGRAQEAIEQANAYRDQVIARATGEAERFRKLLEQYSLAKGVTRDRLYIDALESVLASSSKVLIDVEGGNNMLYLPLDRLANRSAPIDPSGLDSAATRRLADEVIREIESRQSSPRSNR